MATLAMAFGANTCKAIKMLPAETTIGLFGLFQVFKSNWFLATENAPKKQKKKPAIFLFYNLVNPTAPLSWPNVKSQKVVDVI